MLLVVLLYQLLSIVNVLFVLTIYVFMYAVIPATQHDGKSQGKRRNIDLLFMNVPNAHGCCVSVRFKLQKSQVKRGVANNQFCNRIVCNWNNLPDYIVATDSTVHFKKALRTAHFEAALTFNRHC